jgi:hypothetical protein
MRPQPQFTASVWPVAIAQFRGVFLLPSYGPCKIKAYFMGAKINKTRFCNNKLELKEMMYAHLRKEQKYCYR